MAHVPDRTEEAALADTRRRQILDAAADVFARRGFHAASMAEIARSFGMSAGHIYNWFDSKEAIIEALVARDIENFLQFAATARDGGDPRRMLFEEAQQGFENRLDGMRTALQIEILAEASRNPKIAAIVQSADRAVREGLADLLAEPLGLSPQAPELRARVEVMMTIFEGFLIRGLRHPTLDREGCKRTQRETFEHLLRS